MVGVAELDFTGLEGLEGGADLDLEATLGGDADNATCGRLLGVGGG